MSSTKTFASLHRREDVRERYLDVWESQRAETLVFCKPRDTGELCALRMSLDVDGPAIQVDQPVLHDARACVNRSLDQPIPAQRGCRDLNHQIGFGRMVGGVIARGHDSEVGFRLRVVEQGKR